MGKISKAMFKVAESNGVSKELLRYRIKHNWDVKKAVTTAPRSQAKGVANDKDMLALAKKNGISAQLYNSRVKMYGYTELEAATAPIMGKDEKAALSAETRGGISKEVIERAAKNGIAYITLYKRLREYESTWTEEEASTIPPLTVGERLYRHA